MSARRLPGGRDTIPYRRAGLTGVPTRRTLEQSAAFTQLRDLAAPYRFRVQSDAEGCPVILGRYGRIEWADPAGRALAVYCDHPRLFQRLWAIPGVQKHQTGDQEMRALFSPEAFERVATAIGAHRKPGVTSTMAKKAGAKTAFRGTSRPQNAQSPAGRLQHPSSSPMQLQEAVR